MVPFNKIRGDNNEDVPREIALASIAIASEMSQNERHEIVRLIEVMAAIVLIVTLALVGAVYRLSRQASRLNRTSQLVEENHLRLATTLPGALPATLPGTLPGTLACHSL